MAGPTADDDAGPEVVTGRLEMQLPGGTLAADFRVPAGPASPGDFLPLARALADQIVRLSVAHVEAEGRAVSCRAGCGACCRQLVPINKAEARSIRDLVEALPEPRRSEVKGRFAEAVRVLGEAGLLTSLDHRAGHEDDEHRWALGRRYFQMGVACPFLEDESCSIYPDRPLVCREYLVTTPPELCARPVHNEVEVVPLATSVGVAFARFQTPRLGPDEPRWLPLILALKWADSHPEEPPTVPGPRLLEALLARIEPPAAAGGAPEDR